MALCASSGRFPWGQEDNLRVFLLHNLSGVALRGAAGLAAGGGEWYNLRITTKEAMAWILSYYLM